MKKLLLLSFLCCRFAMAQTTSTITGTIEDLTGTPVTSGKVTFTLAPSIDTTMSGIARFTPSTVTCLINGSGQLTNQGGSGSCVINQNPPLQPPGTGYVVDICPGFVCNSEFFMFATQASINLTSVIPTPSQLPTLGGVVDSFSNQTIAGAKTFSGATTISGTLSLPGGVIGNTSFSSGNVSFTGNESFTGNTTFTGATGFSGTGALTNTGAFTDSQTDQYLSSMIGAINSSEYSTVQGNTNFASDAIAAGISVIGSATKHQLDALAGYINSGCNSSGGVVCNSVAMYAQARALPSSIGAGLWGFNSVTQGCANCTLEHLTGNENDMNLPAGDAPQSVIGIQLNGAGTGTMPAAYPPGANPVITNGAAAMMIIAPFWIGGGGYRWPLGIDFTRGSLNGVALQIDAPCTPAAVPCSSNTITATGYDGGNVAHTVSLQADTAGHWVGANIPIVTSFTTTAATTDNVTVTGMTASGHCSLQPTNSGAAGGIASVFVSNKTTNQITVTHTATSGWTFDVMCTPN